MTEVKPLPKGYEDLEISTQIVIRDALSRNLEVEILDRKENFLRIQKGNHIEFIKEASKTRLDSLMTYLVMENKIVSKRVLEEAGIRIPRGKNYDTIEKAIEDYVGFQNQKKVIKPSTTNFGLGIGISEPKEGLEAYRKHLEKAFSFSSSILVEEFIQGPEYRFLVLGEEVVAVCNRVPANVEGDGMHDIGWLVEEKNKDPRRGEGHKTALEKIQVGEIETAILKESGWDWESVPPKGKQVFLRKNSNISTGGDSIDATDTVHPKFKTIALAAAKAAQATICGIDIISDKIAAEPHVDHYAILEINFNPVLYIHEFPYAGKPRFVGEKILELLGF